MEIIRAGPGDADRVAAAAHLFDNAPPAATVNRFLTESGHHLLIAYDGSVPTGFVSGVEMTHPDKGTEMFLYELGVDDKHRGRGIGKALVNRLAALARELGCYGMWTLTDRQNEAALATYQGTGGVPMHDQTMVSWGFERGRQ